VAIGQCCSILGPFGRLNELGLMSSAARFSSVSGGSIASAALAADWMDLNFDSRGVALSFDAVAARIHRIAGTTLDYSHVIPGCRKRQLPPWRLSYWGDADG